MIRSALEKWLARHPMPDAFPSKEAKAAYFASMPADVRNEWAVRKASKECLDPEYNAGIATRARERMMRVDEFPPDVRAMVYEFGLEVVQEFLEPRRSQIEVDQTSDRNRARRISGRDTSVQNQ